MILNDLKRNKDKMFNLWQQGNLNELGKFLEEIIPENSEIILKIKDNDDEFKFGHGKEIINVSYNNLSNRDITFIIYHKRIIS